MEEYNAKLYLRGQEVRMKKDSAVFSTVIGEVTHTGELITTDTLERCFAVGEVEFLR